MQSVNSEDRKRIRAVPNIAINPNIAIKKMRGFSCPLASERFAAVGGTWRYAIRPAV
jgi:hypothetical protein